MSVASEFPNEMFEFGHCGLAMPLSTRRATAAKIPNLLFPEGAGVAAPLTSNVDSYVFSSVLTFCLIAAGCGTLTTIIFCLLRVGNSHADDEDADGDAASPLLPRIDVSDYSSEGVHADDDDDDHDHDTTTDDDHSQPSASSASASLLPESYLPSPSRTPLVAAIPSPLLAAPAVNPTLIMSSNNEAGGRGTSRAYPGYGAVDDAATHDNEDVSSMAVIVPSSPDISSSSSSSSSSASSSSSSSASSSSSSSSPPTYRSVAQSPFPAPGGVLVQGPSPPVPGSGPASSSSSVGWAARRRGDIDALGRARQQRQQQQRQQRQQRAGGAAGRGRGRGRRGNAGGRNGNSQRAASWSRDPSIVFVVALVQRCTFAFVVLIMINSLSVMTLYKEEFTSTTAQVTPNVKLFEPLSLVRFNNGSLLPSPPSSSSADSASPASKSTTTLSSGAEEGAEGASEPQADSPATAPPASTNHTPSAREAFAVSAFSSFLFPGFIELPAEQHKTSFSSSSFSTPLHLQPERGLVSTEERFVSSQEVTATSKQRLAPTKGGVVLRQLRKMPQHHAILLGSSSSTKSASSSSSSSSSSTKRNDGSASDDAIEVFDCFITHVSPSVTLTAQFALWVYLMLIVSGFLLRENLLAYLIECAELAVLVVFSLVSLVALCITTVSSGVLAPALVGCLTAASIAELPFLLFGVKGKQSTCHKL